MKDHPLTPMRDPNLVRVLQRQTRRPVSLIPHEIVRGPVGELESAIEGLQGIAIVDAVVDSDLRAIGRAAKTLKLITGGSGVALGLPTNFINGASGSDSRRPISVPRGGAVILAGSCSTATRKQVEIAIARGVPSLKLDAFALAENRMTVEDALDFVLGNMEQRAPLVYTSADPEVIAKVQEKLGRGRSGELIESFLAELAGRLAKRGVNRFLVAGGETSGAAVGALDVEALEIGPEIDPGVPWTRSHSRGTPIALALKSGNFGSDDFFIKAWELVK